MSSLLCRAIRLLLLLVVASTSVGAQPYAITFSTFFGGSGVDNLRDIATDSAGNVYVTGGTASPDFPTTPGAYDRSFAVGGGSLGSGGPMDVFVAKFTPAGQLVWSTFVGGPNYDRAYAIEVTRGGEVYIAGRAGDSFPTTPGAVQVQFGGDVTPNGLYGRQDPFVAKLSADGSRLLWATYFGTDDGAIIRDIAIDSAGDVYLVSPGVTRDSPHITPGAFQTTRGGGADMIAGKISSDGQRVIWASYFGGSGDDGGGPSVRATRDGEACILGTTTSTDLPVTPGAFDRSFNGGRADMCLAKFRPDGSGLVYATYFGGSGDEGQETHSLTLDVSGNAIFCGFTSSTDLPTTPGSFQSAYGGGGGDVPVAKLSSDGSTLLACTYLGGSAGDGSQGIALDGLGNVYIGGASNSSNFPTTPDAAQRSNAGGYDMFIAKLSRDLETARYITLIGGAGADDGRTAWADTDGTMYVAGHSKSADFPLVRPAQDRLVAGDDGVIVKFSIGSPMEPRVSMVRPCRPVREGDSLLVELERAGSTVGPVTATLAIAGTAIEGVDVDPIDRDVAFQDGQASATVPVRVHRDALAEPTEELNVSIDRVSTGVIGSPATMTLRILDSESAPPNLLQDPGFEANGSGWQKTTNGGRSVVDSVSHTGTRSQQMVLSPQFPREVTQDVAVVPGREYVVGGYARTLNIGGEGAGVQVLWLDNAGATISTSDVGSIAGTAAWTYVGACATSPAAAASARFRIFAGLEPDSEGTVWFDELELRDPNATLSVAPSTLLGGARLDLGSIQVRDGCLIVTWTLGVAADISAEVFDSRGRSIAKYALGRRSAGSTTMPLALEDVASGALVVRMTARTGTGNSVADRVVVIVR